MDPTPDELAGMADLFGGLAREELHTAIEDLAARAGTPFDARSAAHRIDEAVEAFYLVEVEADGETVLSPGPAALPTLPDYGADLPHLLDVDERSIDRGDRAHAAEERLRAAAARAVNEADPDRAAALLDVCYELDAWAGVDTGTIRAHLTEIVGRDDA